MTVERILEKKGYTVFSIAETASIGEVIRELARHRIGVLIVTNAAGDATGIISERDVIAELAVNMTSAKAASDLMTRAMITCGPDDTESDIMERMAKARIRHMPVQHGGKLVGLISTRDILKLRIEKMTELMGEIMTEVARKSGDS